MSRAPKIISRCADCGLGVIVAGEWYMVKDEVWEQAWAGRRKPWHALPGQEILCIGCLEQRIGRTLMKCDFPRVPVNDPNRYKSDRLLNRLQATEGRMFGLHGLLEWTLADKLADLPPEEQARFRDRWRAIAGEGE